MMLSLREWWEYDTWILPWQPERLRCWSLHQRRCLRVQCAQVMTFETPSTVWTGKGGPTELVEGRWLCWTLPIPSILFSHVPVFLCQLSVRTVRVIFPTLLPPETNVPWGRTGFFCPIVKSWSTYGPPTRTPGWPVANVTTGCVLSTPDLVLRPSSVASPAISSGLGNARSQK